MVKFDGFRQGELKCSEFRGVPLGAWDRRDGMVVAAEALKAIEAIDTALVILSETRILESYCDDVFLYMDAIAKCFNYTFFFFYLEQMEKLKKIKKILK